MRAKFLSCLVIVAVAAGMILVGYTPQVKAAEKKEIVFGGSLGISGAFGETGRLLRDAHELWFEDTNKAGGIYVKEYGRKLPVRWILYDDGSHPGTGAKLYEKLITHDKADFLTGPYSSGIVFAGSTVAQKYKKIMISHTGSSDDIFTRGFKYIFNHVGLASRHLYGTVDLIDHLKPRPKDIAIVLVKNLYTMTVAEGAKKRLEDLGFEIVLYEEFPSDIKDASSIIHKAKALNPDIFIAMTRPPSAALFTKQMKELNFRPKMTFLNEGPEMPWYAQQFGKDAEGMISKYTAYVNPEDPMIIEFTKRIKKKDPTYKERAANPAYHCGPYDSLEMIRQGIEATGTLDNTKIAEYFRTHELENMLMGKDHKAKFEDFGRYKGINVNIKTTVVQCQNGEIVVVWPQEYAQAKPWYPLGPWQK